MREFLRIDLIFLHKTTKTNLINSNHIIKVSAQIQKEHKQFKSDDEHTKVNIRTFKLLIFILAKDSHFYTQQAYAFWWRFENYCFGSIWYSRHVLPFPFSVTDIHLSIYLSFRTKYLSFIHWHPYSQFFLYSFFTHIHSLCHKINQVLLVETEGKKAS